MVMPWVIVNQRIARSVAADSAERGMGCEGRWFAAGLGDCRRRCNR